MDIEEPKIYQEEPENISRRIRKHIAKNQKIYHKEPENISLRTRKHITKNQKYVTKNQKIYHEESENISGHFFYINWFTKPATLNFVTLEKK